MSLRAWCLLILLSLIWGAAFTFSGAAVREMGFQTVVFLRVSLAAVTLLIYLALVGKIPTIGLALGGAFLVMGLFNNAIPFSLLFWAQSPDLGTGVAKVSSGLASILNATTPIFSMAVASFIFREESFSAPKIAGIGFGVIGVVALFVGQGGGHGFGQSAGGGEAQTGLVSLGLLGCLGAALSYGFAVSFGRRFARLGLSPAQGAFGQLLGSSLIMLPLVLFFDQPWLMPAPSAVFWWSIAGLALASTAIAYLLYFWLIANAGATNASLVTLLVPASAMVFGALFLAEGFGLFDFVGLGLILIGLVVIDGRLVRLLRRQFSAA